MRHEARLGRVQGRGAAKEACDRVSYGCTSGMLEPLVQLGVPRVLWRTVRALSSMGSYRPG